MKPATIIWLWIAGGLVLIGVILLAAALVLNHGELSLFGGGKLEKRTVGVEGPFEDISIRTGTEDLVLLPAEDGVCRIEFLEQKNTTHSADVKDGTLCIETVQEGDRFFRFSLFSDTPKVTLYLPQREYGALTVEESTGAVTIPQDFSFARIDITASTGNINCSASAAEMLKLRASTGNLRVERLTAGALSLSVSTGRVEVESVVCAGDADVHVSTGDATVKDLSCFNFSSDGSTGDAVLEDVIASGLLKLERSTGDLELKRCDAAELEISTDTGDVNGSLRSEKVFVVRSDTGRIDVPETTAGGRCKITTDTGDVRIVIAK